MRSQGHRNSEFYWEGITGCVLGGKILEIFWILAVGASLAGMSCAIIPLRTGSLKFPVFHLFQGREQVPKAAPPPELFFPSEFFFFF